MPTEVRFHRSIESIAVDLIRPNSFNSNEVSAEEQEKIKDDILVNGFFGAILVRPLPAEAGAAVYEIVDGEHRWRALKEIGVTEIPCLVVEHDDAQAKINSIRLNTERGEQNPRKVGAIVKSLEDGGMSLSDVERALIYSADEIQDRKDLLLLPENVEDMIRERETLERTEMHVIFSFMVPASHRQYVDRAVEMFGDTKGLALGEMCKRMVEEGS